MEKNFNLAFSRSLFLFINVFKNIWVGYKVLSALYPDERSKFLQVLLEVIVWNATDENVDEIVNKIVHSKQL